MRRLLIALALAVAAVAGALALTAGGGGSVAQAAAKPKATAGLPPIKHVFIIVLENESASTTFPASGTAPAPYLASTMRSLGAFLPNYYATGHASNDNYISMISGQAPNSDNSADCVLFGNFSSAGNTGPPYNQQNGLGCVYPQDIQNIASQLDAAGLSWKSYNQSMGNTPTREPAECGHPAVGAMDGTQSETAQDAYATRHDPFVYFHNIIDNTSLCDTHVVGLDALAQDLQSSATTPNYVFITPDLCSDGHDATCKDPSRPGGFAGINAFLSTYVPMIMNSPAFKDQNGLLLTTFDEADTSDTSSCCGEIPGPGSANPGSEFPTGSGKGGGRVGMVAISPCIQPGSVDNTPYNHYSMLGSVENIFSLAKIGYAALPGQSYFGSDLFNRSCSSGPPLTLNRLAESNLTTARAPSARLSFSSSQAGATYTVQVRHNDTGTWRALETNGTTKSYSVQLHSGITYNLRVQATNGLGLSSAWKTVNLVVPTLAKPAGASTKGSWHGANERGALRGRVLVGKRGGTYRYSYTGSTLRIIATREPAGGTITVNVDGKSRTLSTHATGVKPGQTVYSVGSRAGRHHLVITVKSGQLALEGLQITDLR